MKNIVELFRDSFAFKVITGIVVSLFTHLEIMGNEIDSKILEKESIEITFDQKFMEMNSNLCPRLFELLRMNTLVKTLIYLSALLVGALTSAQVAESTDMYKALKKNDSLIFDSAFNKCKTSDMIPIIAEDLEFYHDTGGITEGKDEFFKTVKQNICGNPDVRPYRELVKGTLKCILWQRMELCMEPFKKENTTST